jgi:hypothetical protein
MSQQEGRPAVSRKSTLLQRSAEQTFSKGYALQKLDAKRTAVAHLDETQPALS